jgi:hypothetical protein
MSAYDPKRTLVTTIYWTEVQSREDWIFDRFPAFRTPTVNMSFDDTSRPGRPGLDELVPSRYALRVGEIDVHELPPTAHGNCGKLITEAVAANL